VNITSFKVGYVTRLLLDVQGIMVRFQEEHKVFLFWKAPRPNLVPTHCYIHIDIKFLRDCSLSSGSSQDSSVSIATGYRLDGPGIESQWG
jgi:hypothetical protein